MSVDIEELAEAIDSAYQVMLGTVFNEQRFFVDHLLTDPWWKHLRLRWELRTMTYWHLAYPKLEEPND